VKKVAQESKKSLVMSQSQIAAKDPDQQLQDQDLGTTAENRTRRCSAPSASLAKNPSLDDGINTNIVHSLYVGNLPESCTVEELKRIFDYTAPVRNIYLKAKSHALINFKSPVPKEKAFLPNPFLRGKRLDVQLWRGLEGGETSAATSNHDHDKKNDSVNHCSSVAAESSTVSSKNMFETSVWIGGLPFVWGQDKLQAQYCLQRELSKFGPVNKVEIRGPRTKAPHAFVSFADAAAARAAIQTKFIPFCMENFGVISLIAKAWAGNEIAECQQKKGNYHTDR